MSLLDAHIPQLIASHTAFAAKAGLMRHTIGQAEQQAMSAQAFHQESPRRRFRCACPVCGRGRQGQYLAGYRASQFG